MKEEKLPERDIHPEETVDCNSCKRQNWDQSQQDHHTADEETAVEWSFHFSVHHHSHWYGYAANHKVSHSQGENKAEGGLLNALTGPQGQNNQHITQTAADSNEHFHHREDHFTCLHYASCPANVWWWVVQRVWMWVWAIYHSSRSCEIFEEVLSQSALFKIRTTPFDTFSVNYVSECFVVCVKLRKYVFVCSYKHCR